MSFFSKPSSYIIVIALFVSSCLSTNIPTVSTNYIKGFPEGFEDISKGNYSDGYIELSGGSWYFEDALIGGTTNDIKNGSKAIRIREKGLVRMNYDVIGVKDIKISYAAYDGDGDSQWEVRYSKNSGSSWTRLGQSVKTSGNKLGIITFSVNEAGQIRFEIRKISGGSNRLNLDDITLIGLGKGTVSPNTTTATRDDNMALGNPSNASTREEANYLMVKPQYTLSYNRTRSTANWVSWHLSAAWKGPVQRSDNFRPDNSLPNNWYKVQSSDYLNSGFDRGHLCPSDDRDASVEDNEATFLLTNIVPQAPNNNRGAWADLEAYCRKIAEAGNELYIVAGVYGKAGIGSNGGKSFTLDNGKIVVPESLWKVIVILPVGANDVSRVNEQTRVIAVNIPNKQTILDTKWGEYRLSVSDLEKITGYDFLSNVPSTIQKTLESRMDDGPTVKVSVIRQ